ncbi:ATP-binding protein [Anabaena catenula]|uniref:ATP-binding protein n=1 Tax=Anabaena catenula FACHB-362 TaxID=2692877 RepID=A0ABR8J573_9NOST|nr:ATP-binding protein [Anabaena catenula]MBD2692748.1 ATP-binding protein [Anabaena catenula FACHB-362]
MTTSPVSSIEEINAALQEQNPFAKPPVVCIDEVWGKEFPDVKTLNAHASDAVFQALNQIRSGQYLKTSIAITAEPGTGKTHIISRIRHRLQAEGGALFVYANQFNDLNNIKQGFQRTLGDSLGRIGSKGVTQWQELASEIANQALKFVQPNAKTLLPHQLFQLLSEAEIKITRTRIRQLTEAFRKTKPNLRNPDLVRAILWTLVDSESLYAVNWLSGYELAQYKANELFLPSISGEPFDNIQQIFDLISDYNQLVICFDELDDPTQFNDAGYTKAQVVAGLVKELFENLSKGLILTVMIPATWQNKIKQLPVGVHSRIIIYGNPLDLKYMDGDSIIELVALRLKEFYTDRNLLPPHKLYPFTEDQLRDLSSEEKPPVRRILQWCRENYKRLPIVEEDQVEQAFKKEIEQNINSYLDDNYLLADALLLSFQSLINQTIERVTIKQVTSKIKKNGRKDNHINFKIIGQEDTKEVSIGVAVLQNPSGQSLGAGLKKLRDYEKLDLTRGCLVRSKSKDKEISPHLDKTYIQPIISQGGEFVELKEEEIKPLLAILSVYKKRGDYNLKEEDIFKFIANKSTNYQLGISNLLLKEILSDPSYQIPDGIIGSEPQITDEINYSDLSDSSDFSDITELATAGD